MVVFFFNNMNLQPQYLLFCEYAWINKVLISKLDWEFNCLFYNGSRIKICNSSLALSLVSVEVWYATMVCWVYFKSIIMSCNNQRLVNSIRNVITQEELQNKFKYRSKHKNSKTKLLDELTWHDNKLQPED